MNHQSPEELIGRILILATLHSAALLCKAGSNGSKYGILLFKFVGWYLVHSHTSPTRAPSLCLVPSARNTRPVGP
eukprot:2441941-Prymnesium_polylepis.1